jgi:hypothetical protein
MHPERSCDPESGCTAATTTEADGLVQQAVLGVVLDHHPALLTGAEILREFGGGEDDRVERAIRDLTGAGLLRWEGESILPTRAALHFDALQP